MAITNHERVGRMLELLCSGLRPFVERELKSVYQAEWFTETKRTLSVQQLQLFGDAEQPKWDTAAILATLWNQWNDVFRKPLGQAKHSLVSELREVRNKWTHQRPFSTDDAYRALDSASRLLSAVATNAKTDKLEKMKIELLRVRFDEQVRTDRRKTIATVETDAPTTHRLKP